MRVPFPGDGLRSIAEGRRDRPRRDVADRSPTGTAKDRQNGVDGVGSTPEEYDAFNKTEIARWIKVARDGGIKPE